jgi:ATP-dependent helicase HrpA
VNGIAQGDLRKNSKQNVPVALVKPAQVLLNQEQVRRHPLGKASPPAITEQRHTAWTFGELPELLEIRKGGQTLIGFPALD